MFNFVLVIIIFTGIYAFLSFGQNIITGYGGMFSICQAGFCAVGAYTTAILETKCGWGFWSTLPASVLMCGLLGLLLGLPTLRLSGDYLAIATLGFSEIVRTVLTNWDSLTNGPYGIRDIPPMKVFGFEIIPYTNKVGFAIVLYLVLFITYFAIKRLYKSSIGLMIEAVREDELASLSSGINITRYKIFTFVLGASISGIGGSFYSVYMLYVNPQTFTFMLSVLVLCMVVLGGMGNLLGVLFGSFLIQLVFYLPQLLNITNVFPPPVKQIVFGLVLMIMMIYCPEGLLGSVSRRTIDRFSLSKLLIKIKGGKS